jgi:hypothetical protein
MELVDFVPSRFNTININSSAIYSNCRVLTANAGSKVILRRKTGVLQLQALCRHLSNGLRRRPGGRERRNPRSARLFRTNRIV